VAALILAGFISTGKAQNPISNELQSKSGEPETFRVLTLIRKDRSTNAEMAAKRRKKIGGAKISARP
jgi:hypothetical protein